ncbi:YcaO-like family protein [Rhizohabitans arisaemae]|uniref:YcaO-like family protein n=1 Tax=Rhizohabitans arisaemae TaxID=2720610 RepID=UPI0024B16883|nr:YcaO-like family protein [Rhizohabitans arisaemae]
MSPEETLARVAPIARAAGVTRVGGVGGLDRIGIPVYCAFRPDSRNLAVSQGKGTTRPAARASAVMEAIELWHAERHRLPVRYDTAERLAGSGERPADVAGMVKCPCHEFAPDRLLRWVRGLEMLEEEPVWVPYESVHCDWRLPTAYGEHSFQNGSNGLASGNTMAEAVVHALCEVIERDSIVRFDRLAPEASAARRVDPATVDDPECHRLIGLFEQAGIELIIWDMTSELGVPTYSCVAVEVDSPWYRPLPQTQGSGTHPLRRIALLRAITETAQARAAVIAGSRDDIFDERYELYFDGSARDRVAAEVTVSATRSFHDLRDADHGTANEDLAWLLGVLAGHGHRQAAVVDLTDPAYGLPVVKVVVPGLEWRPWEE